VCSSWDKFLVFFFLKLISSHSFFAIPEMSSSEKDQSAANTVEDDDEPDEW
jgi:hypothetical protein